MEAIRLISRDPELKQTIRIVGANRARSLTGIQLNREIAERALNAIREVGYITTEEDELGTLWLNVLNLLETKGPHSDECRRMLDWVVKQEIIDTFVSSDRTTGMTDFQAAWKAELAYHAVFPREGVGLRRVRSGLFDESPTKDELDIGQPLPETRAKDRGMASKARNGSRYEWEIDWNHVAVSRFERELNCWRRIGNVALKDPYEQHSSQLDKMFRSIGIVA